MKTRKLFAGFILLCGIFLSSLHPVHAGLVGLKNKGREAEKCKNMFEGLSRLATREPGKPEHYDPAQVIEEDGYLQSVVAASGKPLSLHELKVFGVPEKMWPYFDLKTGNFHYTNSKPVELAKENGDAKLKAVRIHWPWGHNDITAEYLKQLQPLLERKPGVEVWVNGDLKDKKLKEIIENMPKSLRNRVKIVDAIAENLWAQDGSKPLAEGKATLVPGAMAEGRDALSYAQPILGLETAGLAEIRRTQFRFEGGNVVVGDRNVFVGPDIVKYAMEDIKISHKEAIEALSVEFGKPVLEIGYKDFDDNTHQIDFHIDLTMAVVRDRKTGKEKVLVGSGKKAAALMTEDHITSQKIPTSFKEIAAGKANPGPTKKGEKDFANLIEKTKIDELEKREEKLDQLADKMEKQGYEVVRVPDFSSESANGSTHPNMYCYTNAIFAEEMALLPEMGVRPLDNYMKNLMLDMGYEPLMLPVAQKSICLNGGIRCLSETFRLPEKK